MISNTLDAFVEDGSTDVGRILDLARAFVPTRIFEQPYLDCY